MGKDATKSLVRLKQAMKYRYIVQICVYHKTLFKLYYTYTFVFLCVERAYLTCRFQVSIKHLSFKDI